MRFTCLLVRGATLLAQSANLAVVLLRNAPSIGIIQITLTVIGGKVVYQQ